MNTSRGNASRERLHPGVPAIGMGLNFHRSETPLGKSIARATAPLSWQFSRKRMAQVPSHVSVVFRLANDRFVYYEALEGEGFRGPLPQEKALEWANGHADRWLRTRWIPETLVSPDQAELKRAFMQDRHGKWKYSTVQLPRMWIRTWAPWLPLSYTPDDVVCSEVGAIMLMPEIDILKLCRRKSADYITPFQLEQAVVRLLYP